MRKIPINIACLHPDELIEIPLVDQVFLCLACDAKFATVTQFPNLCPSCGEKFEWKERVESK